MCARQEMLDVRYGRFTRAMKGKDKYLATIGYKFSICENFMSVAAPFNGHDRIWYKKLENFYIYCRF